jgi:serine protease Do
MSSIRTYPVRWIGGLALAGASLFPVLALGRSEPVVEPVTTGAPEQMLEDLSHQFRAIARRVEPSVVHIEVLGGHSDLPGAAQRGLQQQDPEDLLRRFFGDVPEGWQRLDPRGLQPRQDPYHEFDLPQQVGAGSGWVYDDRGHIVTNHHVVDGAGKLRVRFSDGSEQDAHVVASDARTDVAVIAVDDTDGLHPARVSDEEPQQGDIVFAFGSPLSFDFSMSQGLVSATGRRTGILGPGGYEDFIQTDAAINPGNSGGPLTDVHGQVVGMNSSIASRSGLFSGIGFAIPVRTMRPVIDQLIANGKVERGFLGVTIQDDPDLLRSFGFEGEGVLVGDVLADGPASKSDLRRGDIVTKVQGQTVEDADSLRLAIAALAPGTDAHLELYRDGERREATVELGRAPSDETEAMQETSPQGAARPKGDEALLELGLEEVATLDAAGAQRLGLEETEGVLVEAVRPQSAAAMVGIQPGMVLTEVDGRAVRSRAELTARLADSDLTRGVRVTVSQDGMRRYAFLHLPR